MAQEDDLPFEVVFVSSDDSEEQCANYMSEMHGAWLRVPFSSPCRDELKKRFGCFGAKEQPGWPDVSRRSGIPALVVVAPDGRECEFEARDLIDKAGPEGIAKLVSKHSHGMWP